MRVIIAGLGPGDLSLSTTRALDAIAEADAVIGARRLIEEASDSLPLKKAASVHALVRTSEIVSLMRSHPEWKLACVVMSGDVGLFSGARALREAVAGAVADAGVEPDCVLMDGNPLGAVARERDVVHGDATVACIAAASIVAKVTRDELMVEYDAEYPGYAFAQSKGYASADHIAAIKSRGLTPLHRVSFCGNFLQTESLF